MSSGKIILVCAIAIVCCVVHQLQQQVDAAPPTSANREKPAEAANQGDQQLDSLLMIPSSAECGPDEVLRPGAYPTCEPTCDNPNPFCIKMFYTSFDYVPCHCKQPLVRDTRTKRCVSLNECPQRARV